MGRTSHLTVGLSLDTVLRQADIRQGILAGRTVGQSMRCTRSIHSRESRVQTSEALRFERGYLSIVFFLWRIVGYSVLK